MLFTYKILFNCIKYDYYFIKDYNYFLIYFLNNFMLKICFFYIKRLY